MKPHKEYYKPLITAKKEMTQVGLNQWHHKSRHKARPITFDGKGYGWINITEINTPEKLAEFVYEKRGVGTHVISFWGLQNNNNPHKQSRYNSQFICRPYQCKYRNHKTKPCQQYKRVKQGSSCRANRKRFWNWCKRAEIVIREGDKGIQYSYTYGKMKYLPFWRA